MTNTGENWQNKKYTSNKKIQSRKDKERIKNT